MPPPSIPGSAFRLQWRRTWPDEERRLDDFEAREGKFYCRIYLDHGGPQKRPLVLGGGAVAFDQVKDGVPGLHGILKIR